MYVITQTEHVGRDKIKVMKPREKLDNFIELTVNLNGMLKLSSYTMMFHEVKMWKKLK